MTEDFYCLSYRLLDKYVGQKYILFSVNKLVSQEDTR